MAWQGKTVFITGASSGIGAEMARQLSSKGAILGLLARRSEELRKLKKQIESSGGTAQTFTVDVTDYEGCVLAVRSFVDEFKKIDVLVANAGIAGRTVNAWEIEPEDFEKVIRVNLLGAVNMVRAVLPHMIDRKEGHLVAISSLASFRGLPKSASYCASKSAMNAFFESVRVDLFSSGIDVTIVQPGFIKTPLTAGRKSKMPFLMDLEPATAKIIKAIEKRKKFYAFPFPLSTIVCLARFLPARVYDRLVAKQNYRE